MPPKKKTNARKRRPRAARPPAPPRLVRQSGYALPGSSSRERDRASYLKTLTSPFVSGAVRLGMGTMVPTQLKKAGRRFNAVPLSTSTCLTMIMGPTVGSGPVSTGSNLAYFQDTISGNAVSAGTLTSFPASQGSLIANAAQTGRVVSAGIRGKFVGNNNSTFGGIVYGGLVYDSWNNIIAKTTDQLIDLPGMTQLEPFGPNIIKFESQFRPVDTFTFAFAGECVSASGLSGATLYPYQIVVARGFTAAQWSFTTETVLRLETISGTDQNDGDEAESTLDSGSMSIEDVSSVNRMIQSNGGETVISNWVDTAVEGLDYFVGRQGRMGRIRGA